MALLSCLVAAAAMTACEPDRAVASGVVGASGAQAIVYPESVSVVNVCGTRMSIRNANNDSVAVQYAHSLTGPRTSVIVFKKQIGTTYSEFFVIAPVDPGVLHIWVGTYHRDRRISQSACPARPAVPALPPTTVPSNASGAAYLVALDPDYPNAKFSDRRIWLRFKPATPQEIRQAVLDELPASVIGGVPWAGDGLYYIEIGSPIAGSIAPVLAAVRKLARNAAVWTAWPDHDGGLIRPAGLAPKDNGDWNSWRFTGVDLAKENWYFESDRIPLAWGCTTGDSAVQLAFVDEGLIANSDVPVTSGGVLGPPNLYPHASRVSSILRANGNDNTGMAGVTWAGTLKYFYKDDDVTQGPGIANPVTGFGYQYAIKRALTSGARVVNISLRIGWKHEVGGALLTALDSMRYLKDTALVRLYAETTGDEIVDAFRDADNASPPRPRPLVVIAAGNDSVDSFWSGVADVVNRQDYAVVRGEVIVVGGLARDTLARRWVGSDYGRGVEIFAPGESIQALEGANAFGKDDGTSYAAPQVAGVAALMLAIDSRQSAVQLKVALIAGASAGGRQVLNPGAASGVTPVLDAYEALRQSAKAPGAGLCGNRLWVDATGLNIQRGSSVEFVPLPYSPNTAFPLDVQPRHVGRSILLRQLTSGIDSSQGWGWGSTGWNPGAVPVATFATSTAGSWYSSVKPIDLVYTGIGPDQDLVWLGRSHAGDSTLTASIVLSPSLVATLSLQRSTSSGSASLGSPRLLPVSQPAGASDVVMADDPGFYTLTINSDQRVVARPKIAVSPAGRFAYVAWNTTRGGMTQPGALVSGLACGVSDPSVTCRSGYMSSRSDGFRIERLNLSTGAFDSVVVSDATRNVMWMSLSEDGTELAYATVRDSSRRFVQAADYYLDNFLQWQASAVPLNGLTNLEPCALHFRSLTTALAEQVIALNTVCRDSYSFQQLAGFGLKIPGSQPRRRRPPDRVMPTPARRTPLVGTAQR